MFKVGPSATSFKTHDDGVIINVKSTEENSILTPFISRQSKYAFN